MVGFDFETLFPASNPVFSGGFGLALLAGGAQALRMGTTIGMKLIRRHFLVTLEVTSKDRSYPMVLQWLYSQGTRTQHLSVETSLKPSSSTSGSISYNFVPGPGQHLINYRGKYLLVQRVREQQMVDLNSGKPWEKLVFTSYGRSTTEFDMLLQESFQMAMQQEEGKTLILTNWGSEWRQFGQPRKKRPLDSVILDNGVAEKLTADVTEWMNSSEWYYSRGIPYRRGYLLHGPPGSGKSSFIMALAGKLGYNICILNLSERGLTDDRLGLALSTVPPQSIVLLEDVDAAFPTRDSGNSDPSVTSMMGDYQSSKSDVTFSGLLNVLDGVSSSEERLVFMTTNYVDRLDPALIRPGRVDIVQLIDNATDYQIAQLFARFYPDASEEQVKTFIESLRKIVPSISMAALQGHLVIHKQSAHDAIQHLHDLSINTSSTNKSFARVPSNAKHDNTKPKKIKMLSVDEVDRMYFNPQEGWDKGIKDI